MSVLRHLKSDTHSQNYLLLKNTRKEERETMSIAKQCALNCASVAHTTLFFAESRLSYEYHITDVNNSGGLMGTKNHSQRFPGCFLPHVYSVIILDIKHFVISNDLPFGVLADRMTSNHLARHDGYTHSNL